MLGARGSSSENIGIADQADFVSMGDRHVSVAAASYKSEWRIDVRGNIHNRRGDSRYSSIGKQVCRLNDVALFRDDELSRQDAHLSGGAIGLQQGNDSVRA